MWSSIYQHVFSLSHCRDMKANYYPFTSRPWSVDHIEHTLTENTGLCSCRQIAWSKEAQATYSECISEEDCDSSFRQAHEQKVIAGVSIYSNLHILSVPSLALRVNSTLGWQCSLPQKLSPKTVPKWGWLFFFGFVMMSVNAASGCWKRILLGSTLTRPCSTIKSIDTLKTQMRVFTSEWQGTDTDISPSKSLDEKTALREKTKAPVALIFCKASTANESIYPELFWILVDSSLLLPEYNFLNSFWLQLSG